MKKITIILSIFALSFSTGLKAQHEVKTNVLGLIFNQFGVTYEYVLDDNMGLGGTVSYLTSPSSFAYDYTAFSLAPEFKFYLDPSRRDADKYFVGGYLKYRYTSADEYLTTFNDDGDLLTIGKPQTA